MEPASLHIWRLWGSGLEVAPSANCSHGRAVSPPSSAYCAAHLLSLPINGGHPRANCPRPFPPHFSAAFFLQRATFCCRPRLQNGHRHVRIAHIAATHSLYFPPFRPQPPLPFPWPDWVPLSKEERRPLSSPRKRRRGINGIVQNYANH